MFCFLFSRFGLRLERRISYKSNHNFSKYLINIGAKCALSTGMLQKVCQPVCLVVYSDNFDAF